MVSITWRLVVVGLCWFGVFNVHFPNDFYFTPVFVTLGFYCLVSAGALIWRRTAAAT